MSKINIHEPNNINYSTSATHIPEEDDKSVLDAFCKADDPIKVDFSKITLADYKIKKFISKTPCERSILSDTVNMEIYFKKEINHPTGSFKERGALNALLSLTDDAKTKGVVAASAGNHSLALSYHGNKLGIPITVVMPTTTPLMKLNMCIKYGADVHLKGTNIEEARRYALKIGEEKGLIYINGYDHPDVIAGQGTVGLQIVEQVEDIDAVIIPIGGGGLVAGMAVALKTLKKNILVYGVETEKCPSFANALAKGKPTKTESQASLADGLAVPTVGHNAFHTARKLIDRIIVLEEDWVASAILTLLETEKIIVEGAGATGLAPVLAGKVPELIGKKIVIPLCGGNIDTTVLGRVIDRGLAFVGRLVRFVVVIKDSPGALSELTNLLMRQGVSIKDIFHERAWVSSDIFCTQVKCVIETRNMDHAMKLKETLSARYDKMAWGPRII